MKIHNNWGICVFIASAVLDISMVKCRGFRYDDEQGIGRSQENAQWINYEDEASSQTEYFPQRVWKEPDVHGLEQEQELQNTPNDWTTFKDSISPQYPPMREFQFVQMSRNDKLESQSSFAVRQPNQTGGHVRTGILSVAAAVMFVVVLVICIHAPCTCLWRRRHRSDIEVDLISCPNPTAHDGKCGKCLYDRVSKKHATKYGFSRRKFSSPAAIATNEELFMPYENQPPFVTDSNKGPPSNFPHPKKSRSIVQAILKRSRDRDKFRYEFLASRYGYDYKQFRDSYKRSSIYDEQDPNWYSAGEFLNNQSSLNRGQKNYGSTDAGNSGGNSCCHWSRAQQKSTNQSAEDIIKLQPRRRQTVELQEFPVGFSGTYVGVSANGNENLLFDPMHDVTKPCRHGNAIHAGSDSNIDMYFSRMDEESNNNHVTDTEKRCRKTRPTSPQSSAQIVQHFPTQFDYDPKFVQNEGDKIKKVAKERKKAECQDEDSEPDETSSDDLLSFDEWDELQERREQRSQEFLYSPHMQASRQCHHLHHSYPAVLRYPEVPRDTRPLPREYKTRMRRHVARSETELRRSSGYFGQAAHAHCKRTESHSSSDTSLHRMQIEKELAAVGLAKRERPKHLKDATLRIRDNLLDPLAGLMSPVRPLEDTTKCNRNHSNAADPKSRSNLSMKNDLEVSLKSEGSYVVKLPFLESSCKETFINEYSDEGTGNVDREHYKGTLEKKLNDDDPEPNYNRVQLELDPHYIKNSYLRDEPVRDTDSDDGDDTSRLKNRPTECQLTTGNGNQSREETFSSNRSTRL